MLIIFLISYTCSKSGDETYNKDVIVSKLKPAIESFIQKSGYKMELLDLTYLRNISSDGIASAIDDVMNNAAFIGETSGVLKVYKVDATMTPDPVKLAAVRKLYKNYLDTVINKPDMALVSVDWKLNASDKITTYGVVRKNGDILYEPILSVCYLEPVNSTGSKGSSNNTSTQDYIFKNMYGICAVYIRLGLTALSNDGCHATFNYVILSQEAVWPLDLKVGTPTLIQYCQSKANCSCRALPDSLNLMECAHGITPYEFTARSGPETASSLAWNPIYMKDYKGTIEGSICASSTSGGASSAPPH
jgi:hypothetical protein